MKKFKKAIMGVTALVMACSMTAFAACSGGNDTKDPSDPNNPNGPSEGTLVSPAKSDTVKVMEAIQTQSFKAASLQYALDTKSMCTSYDSDKDGKILEDATKTTSGEHNKTSGSAKINVNDLELDATSYYFEEALDAEGKKVADSEMENYSYMFARGGHLFSAVDEEYKQITDFSDVTLEYSGDMGLPEELTAILAALPANGMPADELTPLSAILNLAETYGGATFADKKLTINFNKTAYGLYNDVLAVIDALNEDTKVGDVIKAKPVKALIESLTYGVSAKDILDQVAAMAGGQADTLDGESEGASSAAMIGAVLELLPEATAGESVYDYLVKVLESKDVAEAVFKMIAPGLPASAVAPIAEFKVIELLQLVAASMQPPQNPDQGTTMSAAVYEESADGMQQVTMAQIKQQVKGYLNQMVSVTEDKVTVTMEDSAYEVSALEIVYTVGDDYAVSSVSVSGSVNEKMSRLRGINHDGESTYKNYEIENTHKLTASIEFAASELTLTNISENTVEMLIPEYEDQIKYIDCGRVYVYGEQSNSNYDVCIGAEIKDGEVVGIKAYTEGEYNYNKHEYAYNQITNSSYANGILTFEIEGVISASYSVSYKINEYDELSFECELNGANTIGSDTVEVKSNLYDRTHGYIRAEYSTVTSTVAEIIEAK